MKTKLASVGVFAILVLFAAACEPPVQPQHVTNTAKVPITGTPADGTGSVTGDFVISQFVEQDGAIAAVGTYTGSITDGGGEVTQGAQDLTVPVTTSTDPAAESPSRAEGTSDVDALAVDCPVLHLNLGPLHLDLLGLVVDLNQVILDIVAQTGAGNLLGNLLCAVTGLLDGVGTITQIVNLLNQILALLPRT